MNKIKLWGLVILTLLVFYLLFCYLDKEDEEALNTCKQENSTQYCMKLIHG